MFVITENIMKRPVYQRKCSDAQRS